MALKIHLSTNSEISGPFEAKNGRYRKDFIREGVWVLDTPDGKRKFTVSKTRLQRWQKNFKLMLERGVSVPLTVDHIQVKDPTTGEEILRKMRPGQADAQRGFVTNLLANDGVGECEVQPADEESTKLLNRCPEVSLELTQDFHDGHGNYYDEAITAITLTPKPVIPGQKLKWEKVMASRELMEIEDAVVCLSAEPHTSTQHPTPELESHMDLVALLRKLLNLPENTPEADVKVKLSKVIEDKLALVASADVTALAEAKKQVTALSRERDELKVEVAKKAGMPEVDEDAAEMAANGYKSRINALADRITPAQKTMLSTLIVGEGKRNVIMLSRKAAKHVGLEAPLAESILSIFESGNAADMLKLLTESSKNQSSNRIELSRVDPNGTGNGYDPELQKKMIARANGAASTEFAL